MLSCLYCGYFQMESFVIGKGAQSYPCLAIYLHGEMAYFSSDLGDLSAASQTLQSFSPPVTNAASGHIFETLATLIQNTSSAQPVRLFISGDRSSVGKSTCCLYLLAALLQARVSPADLAYIKPITQCEAEQPVVKFCTQKGIANRGVGACSSS
jgi:hypothetical protein